ncbi:MAG: hypothetical protein FJZ15_05620 [Candidatus Omnitrophica bacterium]|nr:hypothetical protein [Candidatus Omnitrophota bacterium]
MKAEFDILDRLDKSIEKAFYVYNPEQLSECDERFDRVYFGSEFCENKIPSIDQLDKAVSFSESRGLKITFVTGHVTDIGIERLRKISSHLKKTGLPNGFEVVINDWGLLSVFEDCGCIFSLGRLLIRQKTDPRIAKANFPSEVLSILRDVNINDELAQFMKERNILRLEFDNSYQGIEFTNNYGFLMSLYLPFGYITTGRTCHYFYLKRGQKSGFIRDKLCSSECEEGSVILNNKNFPGELFLRGKTLFFKNDDPAGILKNNKIDRVIFERYLPV